jgi:hypothetical protein
VASKKFTEWLKGQKHKPGDKITNFQRLTSKYLVPKGVTTWGEWYEEAGVTPTATEDKGKGEEPKFVGSFQDRLEKAKKEQAELEEARDFDRAKGRDELTQREATRMGDIYDQHATALKPQLEEYEFKLDLFARKIAKGDKLTVIEEKEIEDITKKYESLKKSYDEARQDAVDMYYGRIQTPVTKTGKKVAAEVKAGKPATSVVEPSNVVTGTPAKPVKTPAATTPAATPATTPATGTTPGKPAKNQPRSKTTATELARESGELYGSVKADDARTAELEASASGIITSPDLQLSQALFNNVPGLKAIYDEYVDPKSKMTDKEFIKRINNDTWFLKNSKEIRARFVQLYNYQDLKKSGLADGSTDYEKQIAKIEDNLRKNAVILGSDIASNPSELTKIAENLYITDRSEDDSFITDLLAARIRPVGGTLGGKGTTNYSGQALQNYNALVKAARDNGFQVADIIPGRANVDQLLQNIAAGKIDINRVIGDARTLASQGQPQYVRDLLAQGYNLNQVYAPYRQTMANILEIGDPDQIDLNDPILRNAITDKGDMNLYDFKKELRKDNRWQYTENAKQEVSDAALGVLRDFGFQG